MVVPNPRRRYDLSSDLVWAQRICADLLTVSVEWMQLEALSITSNAYAAHRVTLILRCSQKV
jgi:hypothetical protein